MTIPLRNNTVSTIFDEIGEYIETQLAEELKSEQFSALMDESNMRDREALVITCVRYIDKGDLAELMLFGVLLESTTTSTGIHSKLNI